MIQQYAPLLNWYFNFYDVFYIFRIRGSIFRKTDIHTDTVSRISINSLVGGTGVGGGAVDGGTLIGRGFDFRL